MGLNRIVAPVTTPVTLAEAKEQVRVTGSTYDAKLTALIAATTATIENMIGRSLAEQTWELTLDAFAPAIQLPRGPVQSVTSVEYVDVAGDTQTVSTGDYTVDLSSDPQWVVRNSDAVWPEVLDGVNAVTITYVAGYETLPADIKNACLILISYWFDQPEGRVMPDLRPLLEPYQTQWIGA